MKTLKLFSLLLILVAFSCSNKDAAFAEENESFKSSTRTIFPIQTRTWAFGRPSSGPQFPDFNGGCFTIGSCEPIAHPWGIGAFETDSGVPVEISLISPNELHVKVLSAPTTIEAIQEMLDADPNSNYSAEDIYNTMTSNVPIDEPLSLGVELSQLLEPNCNELIIVTGDYPIDYSNSEFGEFVVVVEQY